MPQVTTTTGSGKTKRGIVEYDWAEPGNASVQFRTATETFDRSSFARLSRCLTGLASPILNETGLPCDPERAYVIRPDGT